MTFPFSLFDGELESTSAGTFTEVPQTEVDLFNQALAGIGDYRIDLDDVKIVASATNDFPIQATSTAHGYANGDLVLALNFNEMTELNRRVFRVRVANANAFYILDEDGREYPAEATGGEVYRLSTGNHVETVFRLWKLIRREVLEEHAWNEATRYARLARLAGELVITGITQASPAVVTSMAHGMSNGDIALLTGVAGMEEVNGRYFTIGGATANTYQLSNEDSTTYAAYTSGGVSRKALSPLRPDFGYKYRYDLPADCIRVLTFAQPGWEDAQWEVVRGEIYTDKGITVPIRYTALLRDPALFGSNLFAAFAAYLAREIAPKLTDSVSREERADARWEKQLSRAKRTDGQEQGTTAIVDSSFVTSRY